VEDEAPNVDVDTGKHQSAIKQEVIADPFVDRRQHMRISPIIFYDRR
jgi:hypothetical protein